MRTTRSGRSLSIGTSTRPADPTLDRWTDVEVCTTSDNKCVLRFVRYTHDGRFVDDYECVIEDETTLIDLATQALHGVVGIQATEDLREAIDIANDQPTALDDEESIAAKAARRGTAHHRRVKTGNVKNKSR